MGGARNISWGSVVGFTGDQNLAVVVWAPSAYLFEHEQNWLGLRPRIKLNVSDELGQIIEN